MPSAVLSATQTFTGQNAFQNQVTVSSNLFILNGNVGIGTTNPSYGRLHVKVGTDQTFVFRSDGATSVARIEAVDDAIAANVPMELVATRFSLFGGNVGMGTQFPATKLHMSSGTLTIDGNVATSLTTTGNVGIGTTGPGTLLDVNGSAQFGSGAVKSTFSATGALNMASGSNITLAGGGMVSGLAAPALGSDAVNKTYVDNLTGGGSSAAVLRATQTFTGQNAFQNQVTVSSNLFVLGGNVGIGTAGPGFKLDVNGTLGVAGNSLFTSATGDNFRFHAAGDGYGGGATDVILSGDGPAGQAYNFIKGVADYNGTPSTRFNIDSNGGGYFLGNLGIGTAAPGINLDVSGAARILNQGAATNASSGKGLE
ncbi:MAG: hypothetical protein AABZ63_00185, partial [Actinomycetota bacterium]